MAAVDPLLLAYLPAAALLTASPGPDMAVVGRNALEGGPRAASLTALGTAAGLLLHGDLVAAGVAALLAGSPAAFSAVQVLGAVVLVALGARSLAEARRGGGFLDGEADPAAPWPVQGFLVNALNPKVALFYLAFLPQFVGPAHDPPIRIMLLAAIHAGMNLAWLPAYGYGVSRARLLAGDGGAARVLQALAGLVLAGLGLGLLARLAVA